jgi:predicted acyltransferase
VAVVETAAVPELYAADPASSLGGGRLISLDVLRGATIAAMILVNDPGTWEHIYWPLEHAEWNGWTPTDLIFPFFLLMMGVAMTFSFAARLNRGAGRGRLAWHVVSRSVILFATGLFLNAFPFFAWHGLRIMGVLQRIGICYLAAGLLYLATWRVQKQPDGISSRAKYNWVLIAGCAVAILAGYWTAMKFVPVPGYGIGRLDPQGNLGAFLDRKIMGGHLWEQSVTWDPEGLLSTLPAIATTLIGILTGEWLRSARSGLRKVAWLVAVGAVLLIVGRLLHPFFPINKNLWTSTYAIFTGGFGMLLLAACYWLVDLKGYRLWAAPFLVFGRNAIAVYFLSMLLVKAAISFGFTDSDGDYQTWYDWFYNTVFAPHASPKNASLAFAIFYVLLWLVLIWPLDRKRIYIRI